MKEQLKFLKEELKSKHEIINLLLMDKIGDKSSRKAVPSSPFQAPVVSEPVRSGFQPIEQSVEGRFEPVQWGLHDKQQSPENSFEPVKSGKSTRNRSLPSTAIPFQNRFSALSYETEENQSSNNDNNDEFQTTSQNKERQRSVIA
eukprot:Seg2127.1 transcript_id=Seg2127.1/GoldUCD/mRNA.D3Y31 product="hypothetical protein" protein_id=Seg2127.1/GoldUCD/D3Y31